MSGKSPFLGHKSESNKDYDTVASIIRRIKHGDFRMESDAWKYVSPAAKSLIKGLLTVEVKKRLTIDVLLTSNWINNAYHNNNNNPPSLLMTPLVLNEPCSRVIDRNLRQTFNAYHTVARETTLIQNQNNQRSSSISSSSSSLSSGGASSISSSGAIRASKVQDYLQHQFLNNTASSHSVSIAPLMAEAAFSGKNISLFLVE